MKLGIMQKRIALFFEEEAQRERSGSEEVTLVMVLSYVISFF
jgi:hypothetical protein